MGESNGKRIFVAEDEPVIAIMLMDLLEELGFVVVGPAYSSHQAIAALPSLRFDGALLDVNLGDGLSFPVAAEIARRDIPFCFGTGYGATVIPPEFQGVPVLQKPYRSSDLERVLEGFFSEVSSPSIRQVTAVTAAGRS